MAVDYHSLCAKMEKAGWMSHSISCNLRLRHGRKGWIRVLKASETFQAFARCDPPPLLNENAAVQRMLYFSDDNGAHKVPVLVDYSNGVVRSFSGKFAEVLNVGFLVDLQESIRHT